MATGIIFFDTLIANSDRHVNNLKSDSKNDPRHVYLFDHERALMSCQKGLAIKRMKDHWDDPAIGPYHVLPRELMTSEHFHKWNMKVSDIPDWFLEEVCEEARGTGANKEELQIACEFLKHRKKRLAEMLRQVRGFFPNLTFPLVF